MLPALVEALLKLRRELQQMGSDLVVAPGPWEEYLPALAMKVGARAVIAEEEVEFKWVPGIAWLGVWLGSDMHFCLSQVVQKVRKAWHLARER